MVITHNAFQKISHFKVGDFLPTLSDHCPITALIHVDMGREIQQKTITNMNQLEQRYIWNSNNDQSFHEVLSSPSFVAKVCLLSEKQACPKQLAQGIRDIIIEAADIYTNNKPWFDGDCKKIKSHKVKW